MRAQLAEMLTRKQIPAKGLASLTGKIISISMALGPVARLMTRSLYALINTRQTWCELLNIIEGAKEEIQFWLTKIQKFNGQDIWLGPSALRVVYSDASNAGYGGYTVEHGCYIVHGLWLPEEVDKSST